MKRQETKIYCCECKYFHVTQYLVNKSIYETEVHSIEECNAPDNFMDTYYAPKVKRMLTPENRNYCNSCKMFERKVN